MTTNKKRVTQLNCNNCGAPIEPEWGTQIFTCSYCHSVQHLDIDWKKPEKTVPDRKKPEQFTVSETTPEPVSYTPIYQPKDTRTKKSPIFIVLVFIVVFSCIVYSMINRSNKLRTRSLTLEIETPVMQSQLPSSIKAGEKVNYKGWTLQLQPSISVRDNRIGVELLLTNWQSSKQLVRYQAKNFTLYLADGTIFPSIEKPCTPGSLHENRQFGVESFKTTTLKSYSNWCNYETYIPEFLGKIPVNEKQLYLKVENFGVFDELVFVIDL